VTRAAFRIAAASLLFAVAPRAHANLCDATQLATIDLAQVKTIIEVEDHLWVVHATDAPVEGGVLMTHLSPEFDSPTEHVSIGQLVPPHENGTWEDKTYAVLMPMKPLYSQIISFQPNDTILVGDVHYPMGTIIVAPQGYKAAHPNLPWTVVERQPGESLRVAVDRALKEAGAVRLANLLGAQGGDVDTPVSFKEFENRLPFSDGSFFPPLVNTPEFFKPLLDKLPNASYGTHNRSLVGEAGRLGEVMFTTEILFRAPAPLTKQLTALFYAVARVDFERMVTLFKSMDLPPSARASVEAYATYGHRMMELMQADLSLRGSTGKTIFGGEGKAAKELLAGPSADAAQFVDAARARAQTLADSPKKWAPYDVLLDDVVPITMSNLRFEDLPAVSSYLDAAAPGVLADLGGPGMLKLRWASARMSLFKRADAVGAEAIASERLEEHYREAYREAADALAGADAAKRPGLERTLADIAQNFPKLNPTKP
jgi:hypothetical protein